MRVTNGSALESPRRAPPPAVPARPAERGDPAEYDPPVWIERHSVAARRAVRGLVVIALALAAYLFFLSPEGYFARRDLARRIDIELSRRAEIVGEIGRVEDQVSALSADPEAIERLARDELGYERPGESTLDPNL